MGCWRSTKGRWIAVVLLLCVPVGFGAAVAQQTKTPTLTEILQRLEDNLHRYNTLVPSFFCDEHAVATTSPDPQQESSITISTFRLMRMPTPVPDGKSILEESREVRMVNEKPATGDRVSGPAVLSGAFSSGLALVSLGQQACMRYTLKPDVQNSSSKPYIVEFASVPARKRSDDCLMHEDVTGRVLIDRDTMQVMHLEFTVPHHLIGTAVSTVPGLETNPILGRWDVTVEYAPVVLDEKSFWLPTKISDKMMASLIPKRWSFDATYSNYHKLEVTSHILPMGEAAVP